MESELFGHDAEPSPGPIAPDRAVGVCRRRHAVSRRIGRVAACAASQTAAARCRSARRGALADGRKSLSTCGWWRRLRAISTRPLFDRSGSARISYYRIHVVRIEMPPLRSRGDDIGLLAEYFVHRYSREMGKQVNGLTSEAYQVLRQYPWPGNVRELQNIIRRGLALTRRTMIGLDDLPDELVVAAGQNDSGDHLGYFQIRAPAHGPIRAAISQGLARASQGGRSCRSTGSELPARDVVPAAQESQSGQRRFSRLRRGFSPIGRADKAPGKRRKIRRTRPLFAHARRRNPPTVAIETKRSSNVADTQCDDADSRLHARRSNRVRSRCNGGQTILHW